MRATLHPAAAQLINQKVLCTGLWCLLRGGWLCWELPVCVWGKRGQRSDVATERPAKLALVLGQRRSLGRRCCCM